MSLQARIINLERRILTEMKDYSFNKDNDTYITLLKDNILNYHTLMRATDVRSDNYYNIMSLYERINKK